MPPNQRPIISWLIFWVGFLMLILPQKSYSQQVMQQLVNTFSMGFEVSAMAGSFSLGESAITTIEGPAGIITQGFLQPEVKKPCSSFLLNYYPNPVNDKVTILDSECGRLISTIMIYDLYGKWIESPVLDKRQANLENLTSGIYIIRVFDKSAEFLGAFKIMKM